MRISSRATVMLIVALMVLGVWIFTLQRVTDKEIKEKENTCRSTVEFKAKTITSVDLLEGIYNERTSLIPAICYSSEIDLGEKVEEIKIVKKEEIKEELAHYLTQCWWQFANGKYPYTVSMMLNKNVIPLDTLRNRGDYIKKCYDISLPQIVDENGNALESIDLVEVINYMKENNRDSYTYYDYITKYENRPGRLWFFEDKLQSFHTYSIYYSDPNWKDENVDSGYNGIYLIEYNRLPRTFGVDWNAMIFSQEHGTKAAAGCIIGTALGGLGGLVVGAVSTWYVGGVGAIPATAAGAGYGCAIGGASGLAWQTFDMTSMFFSDCETGSNCEAFVVA